jgi:hypothetical protein
MYADVTERSRPTDLASENFVGDDVLGGDCTCSLFWCWHADDGRASVSALAATAHRFRL